MPYPSPLLRPSVRPARILLLLALCAPGCGDVEETSYDLSGVSQKGPFAIGSSVTVQALDKSLGATGKVYLGSTSDDLGSFHIAEIKGDRVEVVVDGYFFDEVQGSLSTSTLALRSVSDLAEGPVRVNLLTSLIAQRMKNLVAAGSDFASARSQAQNELLTVFGIAPDEVPDPFDKLDISKVGPGHAVLLAVSATLMEAAHLSASSPATVASELSSLVSALITDFGADGKLDSQTSRTKLQNAGTALNLAQVRANLLARFEALGATASVPAFEDYVSSTGDGVLNKDSGAYCRGTSWRRLPSLPHAWVPSTAAVLGGAVYFANADPAGSAYSGMYETFLRYDPGAAGWVSLARAPRQGGAGAVVDGKLYLYGGVGGTLVDAISVYDPAANAWSTRAGIGEIETASHHAFEAVAIGGIIFVLDLCNENNRVDVWRYDPAANAWSSGTPLAGALRCNAAVTARGSKIAVAGGTLWGGEPNSAASLYDTVADTWSALPAMRFNQANATAQVVQEKMYVLGGAADGSGRSQAYDFVSGSWCEFWALDSFRHAKSATANGKIFVLGGIGANGDFLDQALEFSP